jgi:GNAT superfamily N-acetyltransferase
MIRRMTPADIPAAMALKAAAGWNQIEADWENVLALEPEGSFVYEADGRVVGSATAACFGRELAWIGMVLVLPDYRRRGIARALMEHCVEYCRERRVACVKLDATDMGRPLYASLGFEDEQPIERWGLDINAASAPAPPRLAAVDQIASLDWEAFGADRRSLLELLLHRLPDQAFACDGGYAMGRPGSNAYFVGPVVAPGSEAARRLIAGLLAQRTGDPVFWDILPRHAAAAELARDFGFQPRRKLVRMAMPLTPEAGRPDQVWATAGFEYG